MRYNNKRDTKSALMAEASASQVVRKCKESTGVRRSQSRMQRSYLQSQGRRRQRNKRTRGTDKLVQRHIIAIWSVQQAF